MKKRSIYYFNRDVAIEDAYKDSNILAFYNGEDKDDLPENCKNVNIESFYDFFVKTYYPLITEVNFNGVDFTDTIKKDITENISQTINIINEHNIKVVNRFLEEEITNENVTVALFSFFKYILQNQEVNKDILYKLTKIIKYLDNYNIKIEDNTVLALAQLIEQYYKDKESFLNIQIYACAYYVVHGHKKFENVYFMKLAQLNDVLGFQTYFNLVKILYPEEKFVYYIKHFANYLFDKNFYDLSELEQKMQIYKLYYVSHIHYQRKPENKELYKILKVIFYQAMERHIDELVFFLYTPLQMSWNGVSMKQEDYKVFNDEIEKKLENYIQTYMMKKYNISPNKRKYKSNQKIKIAFLQERIMDYSMNYIFTSLLQSLDIHSNQYEIIVYDLNFMEMGGSVEEAVTKLQNIGHKYIDLHKEIIGNISAVYSITDKVKKIREKIIEDKVDILVGMHTRPEYNFLFTTRTAPKQVYWSHGNYAYDLENIDLKIGHFLSTEAVEKYGFKSFEFSYAKDLLDPDIDFNEVEKIKKSYGKEKIILGTIGRVLKMNSIEYLQSIISVMQENEDTIYLACGSGNTKEIVEKITSIDENILKRFFFLGHIDAHLYGHVIDIFPDTFPDHQGTSKVEFAAKGKPTVVMMDDINQQRYHEGNFTNLKNIIVNKLGTENYPINTVLKYSLLLKNLIKDQKFRDECAQFNKKAYAQRYINLDSSNSFISLIESSL